MLLVSMKTWHACGGALEMRNPLSTLTLISGSLQQKYEVSIAVTRDLFLLFILPNLMKTLFVCGEEPEIENLLSTAILTRNLANAADDDADVHAPHATQRAPAGRAPVKNLSHWQRHKRGKSGGMPSQRHSHHVLAETTLDTTLAVASQCVAGSRLAPGSNNCVPCAPCTYDGTTDSDPAVACAPCTAGLTSRARPPACPVLRLGPEHLAVIWNCAWDETGASASIGVSSPFFVSSPEF
jgi:hypothetical protein